MGGREGVKMAGMFLVRWMSAVSSGVRKVSYGSEEG